ncbi:thiamine pyrophosphate-requiring protein [Pelagibacterium sp.]|uniref:thiamine pyrophosphate-requiring protein n=1 Tax=Pelagibacterium sp. TaxID=1967288 RepID=UPI003A91A5A0
MDTPIPETGAEGFLMGLDAAGVDYLFGNAGTDFAPVIEALAGSKAGFMPEPVLAPHETVAVGMAHGYYLATGKMQAVMVHTNVGLANASMGVLNAASDNVPMMIFSGRTPITTRGHAFSRRTHVQYGQEMYDQSTLVGEACKFRYELRYPEQAVPLIRRAADLAVSEPTGPVYVSLPLEALHDPIAVHARALPAAPVPASAPAAEHAAIVEAAKLLRRAERPVIISQRADAASAKAIAEFAERFSIPVVEPFTVVNVLPSSHAMFAGYDVGTILAEADVAIVLETSVPWIEETDRPDHLKACIHIGNDPHFRQLPYRTYQTDLAITSGVASALQALGREFDEPSKNWPKWGAHARRAYEDRHAQLTENAWNKSQLGISNELLSCCVSDILDRDALLFNELGVVPNAITTVSSRQFFTHPHSGGLGWGVPAALGAQLADRDRLCIACVGDGSFIFANPVACLQAAEALQLPILIIVKNNKMWNAVRRSVVNGYPDGAAATSNQMPFVSLSPSPDFALVAKANRAVGVRVETAKDLASELRRAVEIIGRERRAVLLDVSVGFADAN